MQASETCKALLEEFSRYMGFDHFTLDENGEALLVFEDELPVLLHFDIDSGLLTFDGDLGRPNQFSAELMQTLLQAANQWRELDLWFSIQSDSKAIHIHRRTQIGLFPEFQQALESFVQIASQWRQLINNTRSLKSEEQSRVSVGHKTPDIGIPV